MRLSKGKLWRDEQAEIRGDVLTFKAILAAHALTVPWEFNPNGRHPQKSELDVQMTGSTSTHKRQKQVHDTYWLNNGVAGIMWHDDVKQTSNAEGYRADWITIVLVLLLY